MSATLMDFNCSQNEVKELLSCIAWQTKPSKVDSAEESSFLNQRIVIEQTAYKIHLMITETKSYRKSSFFTKKSKKIEYINENKSTHENFMRILEKCFEPALLNIICQVADYDYETSIEKGLQLTTDNIRKIDLAISEIKIISKHDK